MNQPLTGAGRRGSGSDLEAGATLSRSMTTPVTASHREADVFAAAHNVVASKVSERVWPSSLSTPQQAQ